MGGGRSLVRAPGAVSWIPVLGRMLAARTAFIMPSVFDELHKFHCATLLSLHANYEQQQTQKASPSSALMIGESRQGKPEMMSNMAILSLQNEAKRKRS
ncbi:hypothetical protein MUK42_13397 [Musa troglodytarum]|uniref:Uncharacterized protein n=1 Tax=Musa troglodytarum TaxID=320322 RepID=A0A9E7GDV1_9LILI|nr:hypothetical protein MUK42_13397 [Musa troglodytarum]